MLIGWGPDADELFDELLGGKDATWATFLKRVSRHRPPDEAERWKHLAAVDPSPQVAIAPFCIRSPTVARYSFYTSRLGGSLGPGAAAGSG